MISLLTWGCLKAFASTSAWWTSCISTPWGLVRNADSWAQLRPKDSEILIIGPMKPFRLLYCKFKCGRRERVPGIRHSRVNNSGLWVSSCWQSCLIACQRLGGEKEAQSHSSNNKKHRLASPEGIPARRMLQYKWKIEIKKSHEGIYLFICLFFCVGLGWRAPDWNATFKNSGDLEGAFKCWGLKMCILFYQFLKGRRAKWHLYLKYAQMFLQTTKLCLLYHQDKGSTWLPQREDCINKHTTCITFKKPDGVLPTSFQKVSKALSLSGYWECH